MLFVIGGEETEDLETEGNYFPIARRESCAPRGHVLKLADNSLWRVT
jgi:hypothetical protein